MKTILTAAAAVLTLAAPAFAESHSAGDAEKGAKEFRMCKACHSIISADGEKIVKGGKAGPNLYGVIGRTAGAEDFRYSSSLAAAGEKGLVWDAETLAAYLPDTTGFLKEYLGDDSAKSAMAPQKRVKSVEDLAAYLASVAE